VQRLLLPVLISEPLVGELLLRLPLLQRVWPNVLLLWKVGAYMCLSLGA
jgi:hypothetical protein